MAYDPVRKRVVLVDGVSPVRGDPYLWEWDGITWTRVATSGGPLAGYVTGMAFDVTRNLVLAMGIEPKTWTWDGTRWVLLNPSMQPPPSAFCYSMTSDTVRQRLVVFGTSVWPYSSDTWEWDGVTWQSLSPLVRPSARAVHAMCFDPVRQRVVLFGGEDRNGTQLGDTWEWDGNTWTQRAPAVSPSAREAHCMAYDPKGNRVLLFSGAARTPSMVTYNDTWAWDGTNWTRLNPTTVPRERAGARMATDTARKRIVMFGGRYDTNAYLGDTWEWDGTDWIERSAPIPYEREEFGLAPDPVSGSLILFGGTRDSSGTRYGDTWAFDAKGWRKLAPAASPTGRFSHVMVTDPVRRRIVVFGGYWASNDTWEWTGTTWEQRFPATKPPWRLAHQAVFDSARNRVVIFGDENNPFGDMWEWDGVNWAAVGAGWGPPPRGSFAVAYDPLRQRTVVFGGKAAGVSVYFKDTWEWDGSTWTQRVLANSPLERASAAMTYDAARGCIVLYGGYRSKPSTGQEMFGDAWELDGTGWKPFLGTTGPPERFRHRMAYDPVQRQILLFGGHGYGLYKDTWIYRTPRPAWIAPYGAGCAGSAGIPALGAEPDSWPWIGATFRATLRGIGTIPAQHLPFWILGDSRTLWGSTPLPFDLTGAGMPGCLLHANPLLAGGLVNSGGSASWPVAIPFVPALAGLSLYAQAGVTDPGANPLGVVLSNASEWRLGQK